MSLTDLLKLMLDLAVLWVIVFPITTFLHECGHALAALVSSDHAITIKMGGGPGRWTWQRGRLRLVINPLPGFVGFTWCEKEGLRFRGSVLISLAGPTVSLFLGGLFWGLTHTGSPPDWVKSALETVSIACLIQFILTILPMRYPRWLGGYAGIPSDGWHALRLLRGQSTGK